MISAGKMPTLAARNCAKPPLTQIQAKHFDNLRLHRMPGRRPDSEEQLMASLKQRAIDIYNWFEQAARTGRACN